MTSIPMKRLVPILVTIAVGLAGCGSTAIQTVTVHKPVPVVHVATTHHVTHPAQGACQVKSCVKTQAQREAWTAKSNSEAETARHEELQRRLEEIRNHTSPNEMSRGEEAERSQEQREERSHYESCYKYGERESNPGCP
jgi:hypothetical protein